MRPGQDWWRIYPWSAYNAWRNIYWYPPYNTNYPFPPAAAYGGYAAPAYYPASYPSFAPAEEDGPPEMSPPAQPQVPHPTGALKAAPPDAAVVRLEVPDRFATVTFDGQKVSSVGTTRYYVTPALKSGASQQYTISAVINLDGRQTTVERRVAVAPGQMVSVDLGSRR
jgi:uncharacterized protein (TIGR03000 family)